MCSRWWQRDCRSADSPYRGSGPRASSACPDSCIPLPRIEISRGVGIAAATGTPDEVARKAPAIGHCELRCQLEHGKMIILRIALLSLL